MTKLTEDEKQFLKTTAPTGGGSVVVVEYLESTMSTQLLDKFPDNSAFDFDYTKSSIWSPVIPRRHFDFSLPDVGLAELLSRSLFSDSSSSNSIKPTVLQRKLSYNENEQEGFLGNGITTSTVIKKMSDDFKRKICTSVCNNLKIYRDTKMMMMKKKKKKTNGLVLPTNGTCFERSSNSPATGKGWGKCLKQRQDILRRQARRKITMVFLLMSGFPITTWDIQTISLID